MNYFELVSPTLGIVTAGIAIVISVGFVLGQLVLAYIDDQEVHVSKTWYNLMKYISPVNMVSPNIGLLPWEKWRYDYFEVFFVIPGTQALTGLFLAFMWPFCLVILLGWGVLALLRSVKRIGKKVCKVASFTHIHPVSVTYKKEEI